MTVYRPKGRQVYVYDFEFRGERYKATTHQTRKEDAAAVEAQVRLRLRRDAGGLEVFDPRDTPRFADWAPITSRYQKRFTTRPDVFQRTLDVVMEFWGAPPSKPRRAPAVKVAVKTRPLYFNLRLGDPIADPSWLLKFDDWMQRRGVSGSTRNSYLSAMSTLYRVALEPEHRKLSRIERNPFEHIRRSPRNKRLIALEPDVVLQWIGAAPYHAALAATIAALAPKMRLATILKLQWAEHFNVGLTRITIYKHKTERSLGLPQVTPVSVQLREILEAARAVSTSKFVITWGGKPVDSIKRATKTAAEQIGLTWGVSDGVTFHILRHSIATLLAELGMSEAFRKELLGHKEIRTTQQYTHLAARSQIAPHEELSAALPLKAIVLQKQPKARPERRGKTGGTRDRHVRKSA